MTIDERIEKLTERHEALALSVENLTHDIDKMRANTDRRLNWMERRFAHFEVIVLEASLNYSQRLQMLEYEFRKDNEPPPSPENPQ